MKSKETEQMHSEISQKFEKIFKNHGYFPRDNFDGRIWFLRDDQTFKSYASYLENYNKGLTPLQSNKLIELIAELNENTENRKDLSSININVEKFISRISEILIETQKIIQRSEQTIKEYNAHFKLNMITENLKILKERIEKKGYNPENKFVSKMKTTVARMDNFPRGEYKIDIKVLEFLVNSNPKLDGNSSTLSGGEERHSSQISQSSVINTKNIKLKNNIKIKEENEIINFKNLNKPSDFQFEDYEFAVFENKSLEDLFKHHSYSGSTFSNFKLKCTKISKEDIYESKTEYFLDLMLIFVEDLYDISKDNFHKNLHIKVKRANASYKEEDNMVIVLELYIELDDLTRSGIMKRVAEIFKGVIDTKRMNEEIIDDIMEVYFQEISETVKATLFKAPEEKRDNCCSCCII
jgi:hypothetical protein